MREDGEAMTTKEEVIRYCMKFPDVYEDYPFHDPGTACMRIRGNRRIFVLIMERQGEVWVNVKCDPEWRDFWRNAYEAIVPGYHMNKEHWNSLILNGSIPGRDVERLIAESYDLCRPVCDKTARKTSQNGGGRR